MGGAALALGGRSVVGAGFALPRDAGRRPAFLAPRSIVVGDGRCGSHVGMAQCRRRWFRAPARCRSETGAPGPALVRGWRCAMRQSRWHGAASSALVSRCRAMPVGDRRSRRRACSRLAMGDAAVTLAWRSVVGAGFALPRDAGRRCGNQVGRAQRHRCWFRAAARCRSETGAPIPALVRGWRCAMRQSRWHGARCRRWFRAAARCRSETGAPIPALVRGWRCAMRQSGWQGAALSALVSRCRAMPVGDRRSSPALVCGWRCAVSRRCAPRCRSEDRRCLRFRRRGRRVRKGPRPRSRGECRRRRPPGRRRPGRSSRPAGGWRS